MPRRNENARPPSRSYGRARPGGRGGPNARGDLLHRKWKRRRRVPLEQTLDRDSRVA
jgi:hypothetical protein